MTEKASTLAAKPAHPRRLVMAALAFVVVALVLAAAAAAPYVFKVATLQGEIAEQIRETTGLVVVTEGDARFDLLPSPHIAMRGLRLADPSGALAVEAEALDGEVRLLPLVVGRIELAAATLVRPKLTIDLDAGARPADSVIGRALHAGGDASADLDRRLGSVTLENGTAIVVGHALARPAAFGDLDLTIDWPDLDSPATLTGSLNAAGIPAEVAAWVAQPSSLMRGETSPIALRIQSTPLDLSANGDFASASSTFKGHVALKAASLPTLLALAGAPASPIAPFANLSLNSDATIAFDPGQIPGQIPGQTPGQTNIDLPGLRLDLDGNSYEGTLAYVAGPKPALSGTLATDRLNLAPFVAREPRLVDASKQWSRSEVALATGAPIDLDLRISATHLRAAPFTIDDAALSVMTRGARTEVALVDGKAYGGDIKGRVSVGVTGGMLDLRGTGSLADADAAALSWDAFGRQLAAGTFSATGSLETAGENPAALMAHLKGWAAGRAGDGELSGLDLGECLREIAAGRTGAGLMALRQGRTPFSSLSFAARIADGVATVEQAAMQGSDATLSVAGSADIGRRALDLQALAAMPGVPAEASRLSLGMRGSFDQVVVTPKVTGAPAIKTR